MHWYTGNFSRDENYKKEINGNARNKKHNIRDKISFNSFISRMDKDEERLKELEDRLKETIQFETHGKFFFKKV